MEKKLAFRTEIGDIIQFIGKNFGKYFQITENNIPSIPAALEIGVTNPKITAIEVRQNRDGSWEEKDPQNKVNIEPYLLIQLLQGVKKNG